MPDGVEERSPADLAMAQPAGRGWRRLRSRRDDAVPAVVLLAIAAQLLLGLVWSALQPPYKGLDEPAHVVGVMQLVYHDTWPAPRDLPFQAAVNATYLDSFRSDVTGSRVKPMPSEPRGSRPSFASAGGSRSVGEPRSQMAQHPPLYYGLVAVVVRAVPGSTHWAYDRTLWLMRLISALLLAPLPLLGWRVIRRLTRDPHLALAGALVPLLLPGIARTGGSVTNDSLLTLLIAAVTLCVAKIVTGDASKRTGAWAGGLACLALLTKGTALFLPAWMALAYAWCWWRSRQRVWPAVVVAAVPTAIGLLWWVANIVRFGAVQPAGGDPPAPGTPGSGVTKFVETFFSAISYRFWASLGNPEPPSLARSLAQDATFTVVALGLVGALAGLVTTMRHRGRHGRPTTAAPEVGTTGAAAIMLFAPVAMLGIVTEGSFAAFHTFGRYNGVQGRYIYPALLALAVLPLLGVGTLLARRLRPLAPVAVAVMAALLQWAGVLEALRSIWEPAGGGLRQAGHVLLLWSPWPKLVTALPFALLAMVVVATALLLAVSSVRSMVRGPSATFSPAGPATS